MYWSVFLFLPAITWQRHLGGKWMSDVWSVCSSVVASSVHWWVERWWGKGRDNAVINSVWTSSVCMQGRPPRCPGSQVSGEFPFFCGSFLVSGVCSCCVECSDDRNTCKRGSLVPADKCMLQDTVVQLTLGFKSDPVWSGHPALSAVKPCVVRVSCDCVEMLQWSIYSTLSHVLVAAIYIYSPCSMECQTWYYPSYWY